MNRFVSCILCAFLILAAVGGIAQNKRGKARILHPRQLSTTEVARRVLPAVSLIVCDDGANSRQGSGFFVGPGLVLTNFHLIDSMRRGTLRTVGGRKQSFHITHILQIDKLADLALLGIYGGRGAAIPSLQIYAGNDIPVGEPIYAFGNPQGLTGTMSPGIISAAPRQTHDRTLLQITAPLSSGSSGGPVVNSRGQVVGVALGMLNEGQNLNFAIPASAVQDFLNRWYKDNPGDPKFADWVYISNLPGEDLLDNEWVWVPQ